MELLFSSYLKGLALRLGDWNSATHTLTIGLPQGSPLSPVLYNVYTKGLADLDAQGPARVKNFWVKNFCFYSKGIL